MGVPLADITAISAASAKLAADTATLNALDDQVTAQQAAITDDQGTGTTADATLSADLLADGPTAVLNPDGTITGYQYSTTTPGYTITTFSPPTP